MRPREERIVVAFQTTTDALAMEDAGRQQKLCGRLIPAPTQITAGCGLAWSEPPENREALEELLNREELRYEAVYNIIL